MNKILVFVVAATIAGAAQCADSWQGTVTMQFAVDSFKKGGGSYGSARATDVLTIEGDRYEIQSETVLLGFITLLKRSSRGTVSESGLLPEEVRDERKTKTPAIARIDRARKVVVLEQGESREESFREPLFDQLSFAYGFVARPPRDEDYRFYMTDGTRVTDYYYRKVGPEIIDTPIGKLETVHLKKVQEDGDQRGADLWLSVANHYLPVKAIVTEKDGGRLEQVVTKITF